LLLRHSSTILLDSGNPIRHHTYQGKLWFEELDRMMCQDKNACEQLCKQSCKAHELTYKVTNHKSDHSSDSDFGLILDLDDVKVALS
jgi:hypothetical protein